jgi:hypothetical protein
MNYASGWKRTRIKSATPAQVTASSGKSDGQVLRAVTTTRFSPVKTYGAERAARPADYGMTCAPRSRAKRSKKLSFVA